MARGSWVLKDDEAIKAARQKYDDHIEERLHAGYKKARNGFVIGLAKELGATRRYVQAILQCEVKRNLK